MYYTCTVIIGLRYEVQYSIEYGAYLVAPGCVFVLLLLIACIKTTEARGAGARVVAGPASPAPAAPGPSGVQKCMCNTYPVHVTHYM